MTKKLTKLLTMAMAFTILVMPVSAFAAEPEPAQEYSTSSVALDTTTETVETDDSNDEDENIESRIGWKKYVCNADNVNVRAGAGTDYKILGTLSKGTVVRVRKFDNGWAKIKFGSQIGYVYSTYLTEQ